MVTDRLPGWRAQGDGIVGITGLPDDPVTGALERVTERLGGRWIGRAGDEAPRPWRAGLRGLGLDSFDEQAYDLGHARSSIWPLCHDLVRPVRYEHAWRKAYKRVNAAFASAIAEEAATQAMVWVHDYHLQLVPGLLRQRRPDLRIGFYLHIPFPAPQLFRRMPMWRDVLAGLAGADHLGFQTAQAAENYLRVASHRSVASPTVGVHPVAADAEAIAELSMRAETVGRAARMRARLGTPKHVILSINPATEAQGIEKRLGTFGRLFDEGRLVPGETVVVQVVTGADRGDLTDRISGRVARINGQHATIGRPCVHYLLNSPDLAERVALYQAADLLVATPLREAATIAAAEFALAASEGAALVLSEFTGSVQALTGAFVVNPHDDDSVGQAIVSALSAPPDDRAARMRGMRVRPFDYDNHAWARQFLVALHNNGRRGDQLGTAFETVWPMQGRHPHPQDDGWLLSGEHLM